MDGITTLAINIDLINALGIIFSVCGSLIAIAWYASGRFSGLETGVKGLNTRLTNIEGQIFNITKTASPVSLTERGHKILIESGLKDYIDTNKEKLLDHCKKDNKIESAYDVQISAFNYFNKVNFENDFEKQLKEYAFKEGINMDMIRRIGGIYFRDVCLDQLKMNPKDIDGKGAVN